MLNTPMAMVAMAAMAAGLPTNTLMIAPIMMASAPTKSHLPMPEMSRLIKVERLAMTKNTPAVPPNAVMIRLDPLLKPSTVASMRESMRPMKKVKPSSTGTPAAEFFVFSMANMKPKAPPRKTISPRPPPRLAVMPVCTPTQAPSTVGSMDNASSQ
ncbi:hypothetical protein FQZ97_1024650 [compost metagenome]